MSALSQPLLSYNIPNIHMTLMHTDVFCSDTLYVHTDPDSLLC